MSIDKRHIKKVAEELGLEVTFNSENPGVLNTTTGEHKGFKEVSDEILEAFSTNNPSDSNRTPRHASFASNGYVIKEND